MLTFTHKKTWAFTRALGFRITLPAIAVLCALLVSTGLVHAENKDLPNLHVVAPGIWRGAAPTQAGILQLKSMGVDTIVDLRIAPKTVAKEHAYVTSQGMNWINLPMGSDPPTNRQVATLMSLLRTAPQHKIYVHCQHGADRTGCMIGIYRVTQDGWTFKQTYAEMRKYGFKPFLIPLKNAVSSRAHA